MRIRVRKCERFGSDGVLTRRLDRRSFVKEAGLASLSASVRGGPPDPALVSDATAFHAVWPPNAERPWPGPDFWPNPLQDWRVRGGRLECCSAGGDRNVALLTRSVSERTGSLHLQVSCGSLESGGAGEGFAGFRLGIKHPMGDYRAAAIYGQGLNAGLSVDGRLFIGTLEAAAPKIAAIDDVQLELEARPAGAGEYGLTLRATSRQSAGSAEVKRRVPARWIEGTLALVSSSGPVTPTPVELPPIKDFSFYPPNQQRGGTVRFWFSDWVVAGTKVDTHPERAYGPILFTLYTVSRGTLKLSAQFPPLGNASPTAALEVLDPNGAWRPIATAAIDPDSWNATFRVTGWDATQDHSYRVSYSMEDAGGGVRQHTYGGTVRRDPVDKQQIKIGLLTCMWDFGFPHADFTEHLAWHKPDILLWTGDQIYEPVGGFGVIQSRAPEMMEPAILDFLRKWFLFGWATRDLTRDIPSVCMTDDHDMFHGNIWGCGGRPTNPGAVSSTAGQDTVRYSNYAAQDSGGYKMAPRWVNMVQRAQTSHLPDPFDPTPVLQGIGTYYTELQWGGVSYAILEDRKWKSAPKVELPAADIVNGFARNPHWNAATQSNSPNAELLGQRQLDFLEYWAANWSGGTWMKFAVSQTPFACLHTEPAGMDRDDHDPEEAIPEPGVYIAGDHLVADHDSGAWPQHERDAAILKYRKGFAAHLCGDQHLGSLSHYGVHDFRDGVYSICTPAISNIWPRRWYPTEPGANGIANRPGTGDHRDAFGNRVSVSAVANPARYPGPGLEGLRKRVTGYTILTCDRQTRRVTVAAWPRWTDPAARDAKPYDGWPATIEQLDNGLHGAGWELKEVHTSMRDPVVQVQSMTGEVIYTLRIHGDVFTPRVRASGVYNVIAFDPDGDYRQEWLQMTAQRRADRA
jgi:alkaline phosphatase D